MGIIAPFEYVALPLSIFLSITIFGDWPDIVSWLGIALIAGAGLYVIFSETVQGKKIMFTYQYIEIVKGKRIVN